MAADEDELPGHVPLYRRVPPWCIRDGKPTSAAFKDSKHARDVLCFDDSRLAEPAQTLAGEPSHSADWGVSSVLTRRLRDESLRVRGAATLINKALVEAEGKITGGVARRICAHATERGWALAPGGDARRRTTAAQPS